MAGASLKGVEEMKAKFRRFARNLPNEVMRALYIEMQIELKEVIKRTPVDDGPLRASIHLRGPFQLKKSDSGWGKVWVTIAAGGPAAPYAVYVHEDPDAIHPVGQWKYLESVLLESRPHMAARVARRIELKRALA